MGLLSHQSSTQVVELTQFVLGVDKSPRLIVPYQVILIVGECVDKSSECGGWSEENSCLTQLPVWRPSCSAPASEQQVVRMDTVRDLSSATSTSSTWSWPSLARSRSS